jgi:hypothetical protein
MLTVFLQRYKVNHTSKGPFSTPRPSITQATIITPAADVTLDSSSSSIVNNVDSLPEPVVRDKRLSSKSNLNDEKRASVNLTDGNNKKSVRLNSTETLGTTDDVLDTGRRM